MINRPSVPPTQHFNLETVGIPVEELSHQDVIRRFQKLQQLRLDRLQGFLQTKQQVFIALLPLLFHQNIPLLPGFIGADIPFGIANYFPDGQTVIAAKAFSKAYSYKNSRLQQYTFDAIFLMGSVGSISFAKNHPLEIWLFHQTNLTITQRKAVQLKAESIAEWAGSLGLDVRFSLLDSAAFLQGKVMPCETESAGHLQMGLLREIFYRGSIYVAGKFPVWWLVPPHEEKNYTAYVQFLQKQRFIQEQNSLDLGGIGDIQPAELIRAVLWQLSSAVMAPYDSLLPLFLWDCYVREYPQPDWLCLHLKQAVYEGFTDIDEFDPYTLIYRKIASDQQASPEQVLLLRRCLALNVLGKRAINVNPSAEQMARIAFVHKIAQQWCWPIDLLPTFLSNKAWNIKRAKTDYSLIKQQVQHIYTNLTAFSQKYPQRNVADPFPKLVKRQLHAFFNCKFGQVELLNTQSNVLVQEDELSLHEQIEPEGQAAWWLFPGTVVELNGQTEPPLKNANSYFEVLVWMVVNGVYHNNLALTVVTQSESLTVLDCHRICRQIQESLKNQVKTSTPLVPLLDAYRSAEGGILSLAFINLGNVEISVSNESNAIIQQQADAFRYGTQQQSLIQHIDSLTLSKWGALTVKRYQGQSSVIEFLTELLNTLEQPLQPAQLELVCNTPRLGNTILYRMNSIYKHLSAAFNASKQPQIIRYFLAAGKVYYCIECREGGFSYWEITTSAQLFKALADPQDHFSRAVFDPEIALKSIIPTLCSFSRPDKIQLFYWQTAQEVTVYVFDEKGALFTQHYASINIEQLLDYYAVFLEGLIKQYFSTGGVSMDFYQIQHSPGKGISCRRVNVQPLKGYPILIIRISAQQPEANLINYEINCNEQVFTSQALGSAVFSHAADFISRYRHAHRYCRFHIIVGPVPISVLGIASITQLQSIHLLHFKQKIEGRLLL